VHQILRLLVVLAAAAATGSAVAAPPEIKRPPVGDNYKIEVRRGTAVSIPLKAYEGKGRPLKYELVSEPEYGQLTDFVQADDNQQGFASVVYTHGDDEASKADSFSFKAKAGLGGGVSRAIKVQIVITDAAPLLDAPPIVSLQAVAGESARQVIRLANAGGGVLRGSLDVQEPFFLQGSSRFNLGRGQSTNVALRFSPQATGSSVQKKILTINGKAARMELRGESTAPFAVQSDDQQLQLLEEGARGTTIRLLNLSSQPQTVKASVEPRDSVLMKSTFSVPPGDSEEVEITIPAEKKGGAFDLAVVFTNAIHMERLELHVPAVPARLELRTLEIDFGSKRKAPLVMANTGGMEGRFTIVLPPGIRPDERAESFSVGPGETREVHLSLDPKLEQTTLPDVMVKVAGRTPANVPVIFEAPEPKPPTPTPPFPAPTPTPTAKPWPWVLNADIKAERAEAGGTAVAWSTNSSAFSGPRLRIVRDGQPGPYPPETAGTQGWWWWLTSLPQRASNFLSGLVTKPIKRSGDPFSEDSGGELMRVRISPSDAGNGQLRWFLEARRGTNSEFEQVSETFVLDAITPSLKAAPEEPPPPPPPPPPGPQTQILGTELASSTRTTAVLKIYLAPDPSVTSYRLERRALNFAFDPKTEKILRNEFATEKHTTGTTAVDFKLVQANDKKYARIEAHIGGLSAGTRSFWRIVPVAGNKDLPPTREVAVSTQPPWQFPWRSVFLTAACALLAWVLYLRWKLSRPPG